MKKTNNTEEKSLIPFLLTIATFLIPLLFILGIMVGTNIEGSIKLTGDSVTSWITSIATVSIAALTFILAKETWYLRNAQIQQLNELKRENIRPNVGIQLEHSPVGIHFINVKISNHGKGIAKNINFHFLDRENKEILENSDVIVKKFKKFAMFKQGIQSLGIGQTISSYIFSFLELGKELNGDIFKPYINIVIEFEDVEGTTYKNSFSIDFAQYEGIVELGGDALHNISVELKKTRELMEVIIDKGKRKIKVKADVYDSEDRKDEQERAKKLND